MNRVISSAALFHFMSITSSKNAIIKNVKNWVNHAQNLAKYGRTPDRQVEPVTPKQTNGLKKSDYPYSKQPLSQSIKNRITSSKLGEWFRNKFFDPQLTPNAPAPANDTNANIQTTPNNSDTQQPLGDYKVPKPASLKYVGITLKENFSDTPPNTPVQANDTNANIQTTPNNSDTQQPLGDYNVPRPATRQYVNTILNKSFRDLELRMHKTPTLKTKEQINQEIAQNLKLKTIDTKLREGQFGSVTMVRPDTDDHKGPIQVLKTTLNNLQSKEIELLKQLQEKPHTNIVAVFGTYRSDAPVKTDTDEGYAEGIALEYIGESLEDILRLDKKFSSHAHSARKKTGIDLKEKNGLAPMLLKKMSHGVLSALNHLHTQIDPPILHMDLNPGNILLTQDGTAKLADFGNSVHMHSDGLNTKDIKTNVFFTSPEIASEQWPTAKAEMWPLGCLIFEAATGERLCQSDPLAYSSIQQKTDAMEGFAKNALQHDFFNQPENDKLKDLLSQLLSMNPNHRPTAEQALSHPYFN